MSSFLLRGALRLAPNVISPSSSRLPLSAVRRHGVKPLAVVQRIPSASITTSKKNRDVSVAADADKKPEKKKNWVSYGFDWETEDEDINTRNMIMFFSVTLCMVGFGFVIAYYPDVRFRQWTSREAYIELARREALGLPPIDENLIPVDQINLPSEEELGDFEVIV